MIEERWRRYENALLGRERDRRAAEAGYRICRHQSAEIDGSDVLETGISAEMITSISRAMAVVPEGFNINPKMVGQMARRAKMGEGTVPIDWAFAEGLAFGSLALEGTVSGCSGQDCGRGTFSQRHAVFYDTQTGQRGRRWQSWRPASSSV